MSKVLWKANSSRHDWRGGAPLRRLVEAGARLGLIGSPERIVDEPGTAAEVTFAGDDPAPWEIFWNVYPFDVEEGWVDGLNTLWFTFDRSRVPDSGSLLESFFAAHTPDDTEYAVIHPYDHWSEFADAHYQIPVTINLAFKGVFWANFVGPGHVEEFDPEKLRDLEAHEVRWIDGKGLFVVATPDLASADAPAAEPVLLRLTERFRAALRPQSRWSLKRG